MRELPAHADLLEEFRWVMAHPFMRAKAQGNKIGDIGRPQTIAPSHGPAPSQAAVNLLILALEKPQEFLKVYYAIVKERAKKEEGGGEDAAEEEKSLEEVEGILEELGQ